MVRFFLGVKKYEENRLREADLTIFTFPPTQSVLQTVDYTQLVGYQSIYGTATDILKIQNRKYQSVRKKHYYMNFISWMCLQGCKVRLLMVKITWGNPASSAALFYYSLSMWFPASAAQFSAKHLGPGGSIIW